MCEQEGFVPVDGYKARYQSIGGDSDQEKIPRNDVLQKCT